MKHISYALFPYDNDSVFALRTNDDGTYSMRTWIGRYDDEYGPQKRRFDLRQSRPYILVDDFSKLDKVLRTIWSNGIGDDLSSVGFNYHSWNQKVCANATFIEAGYDEKYLWVITKYDRGKNDPIDCKVAFISRQEDEVISPWDNQPHIRPIGSWRWHKYEEIKHLNENALTMLDRPTALQMAMDLFIQKWDRKLADFKEWCGVTE